MAGTRAITEGLDPPYMVEKEGDAPMSPRSAYQTISFHPAFQDLSPEEIRLKDYHSTRHEAIRAKPQLAPVRASPNAYYT